MKLNKSPGLDGLTVEFYRAFWGKLKIVLTDIYNKSYNEALMSYSQRSSILSLLFKKGDPLCLDNYRPISLLNVDLKLISHVLAQRLKTVLPNIINVDQTGYVKNRFIGFNLRQIQDIIDYADIYKIEGAIIFVDLTKAFDSLEWNFMLNTLKHFGFNESFINWVKTLYTDIQTCVMNNGWISEMFKNTRGIRHRCPLSALLFVLSVEIMASRLRNNKDIKGFQIKIDEKTHSIKISQLADDTTLFCTSKEEIYIAFNEIETFGSFSGLLMNKNKTGGIWEGKLKHSKDKIQGIKWYEKPIKTLGVYFGNNKEECEKLNWENKIDKMNTLFFSWGKRNLTILGKIMIIKALVIPIFTFVASACVVPDKYRKEIESKCFKFIWDGKPDKIKRNTMIGNFEMGGLNMIDIGSYFASLRASWVSRFVSGEMDNWKLIPYKYIRQFGKNWLIFSMNIEYKKIKDYLRYIPDFYKEILQTWIKMGGGQTKTLSHFAEIRKQLIWGNKFIMFKNKSLMFNNWINSDLIYINDILNENGEISQNLILDKLKYKKNWISEFISLKKAIPNEWYHTLQSHNSIKSVVNFQKDKFIVNGKCIDPSQLSNKYFYNEYINVNFLKPMGINTW